MTSISKIASSGRWRARYRDEDGKQHARHFDRKVEAQRWLNEVTASVVRGDYVEPGAGKVTVAAYAATWQAVQVSSPGTARIVDNAVRCHLVPELGAKPMASILPSTIQGFVKTLEAKRPRSRHHPQRSRRRVADLRRRRPRPRYQPVTVREDQAAAAGQARGRRPDDRGGRRAGRCGSTTAGGP